MKRQQADPFDMAGFDAALGSTGDEATDLGAVCRNCHAQPAASFSFTDVSPQVVGSSQATHTGTWCRSCAQAVGRNIQSRTISRGWFGLTSWLATSKATVGNAKDLRRASRLTSAPMPRTMDSGRPAVLRPAPLGLAFLSALVIAAVYLVVTDPTKEAGELEVGDCITMLPDQVYIDTVETISCDEVHDFEVFAVGSLDADGSDYASWYRVEAQADEACFAAFDDYVGQVWEQSSYDYSYITPTRDGWLYGDDEYQCLLGYIGGQTTGSARGSGR